MHNLITIEIRYYVIDIIRRRLCNYFCGAAFIISSLTSKPESNVQSTLYKHSLHPSSDFSSLLPNFLYRSLVFSLDILLPFPLLVSSRYLSSLFPSIFFLFSFFPYLQFYLYSLSPSFCLPSPNSINVFDK